MHWTLLSNYVMIKTGNEKSGERGKRRSATRTRASRLTSGPPCAGRQSPVGTLTASGDPPAKHENRQSRWPATCAKGWKRKRPHRRRRQRSRRADDWFRWWRRTWRWIRWENNICNMQCFGSGYARIRINWQDLGSASWFKKINNFHFLNIIQDNEGKK